MKTLLLTTLAILLSTVIFAQTPQAFKYQAVIRNNQGKVLVSQIVSLRVSILQNDPLGSPVYIETHQIATNEYGIANLSIGSGTVVTGIFADIAWGTTTHFVKTELDITGNQNYEFIGTSQLLSVPYALYAEKAGNANDDMDKDSLNEIQQLSLNANELSISKGNTIMLPPDNDNDTLNEIQALSLNGNQLTISKGNTITFTGAVDLDADPTNELQIISISNDTIYLTNGGFLKLPKEIDADTTNELQALNYSNDTLYLSKGNFVVIPHNFDNDSINELQTLTQDSNFVTLSNNGGQININDADSSSTNEIQQLTYNNDTLRLSESNQFHFPLSINFNIPDGRSIDSIIFIQDLTSNPFTVPAGYNFYLIASTCYNIIINNLYLIKSFTPSFDIGINPIIIPENLQLNTDGGGGYLYGFLMKKKVEIILIFDAYTNPYTVPSNKILIITNLKFSGASSDCQIIQDESLYIDNVEFLSGQYLFGNGTFLKNFIFVDSGKTISTKLYNCTQPNVRVSVINGYLIDKN